ncbi:MAG: DUF3035 domain-containing protein [Paracoccaceae bacterium]|jgi:hypothetical protein|nr:DUF3035 domain-containing protein [Paracoccaceae bacterium]
MRSFLLLFTLSILSVACSSDKAEVVDLYDIDTGEEIVVLPSAELKIPKNLDVLPEPTPGGENLIDPVKK